MPSLNELVYSVKNTPDGGRTSRDRGFSVRQIEFWIRTVRKLLFYERYKEKGLIEPGYEQDLGCVQLETVDQADCPNSEWGTDVKKVIIPPTIGLPNNADITFFGLVDKQTTIYLPTQNYGALEDYVPFKSKTNRRAERIANTFYIINADKLCTINIRGIFDDPTLVKIYDATGIEPRCFDKNNDPYPIPGILQDALFQIIFDKYIKTWVGAPKDVVGDEARQGVT